ncbi:MAG: HAMP domain-containing histidine kinase [Eubacterium sp.]|nr:HAMP domain-containing histidine kinase [Eubacterium sp.]
MNILTKIKNRRRQKEIKRYYTKPSMAKIILIRGIAVLLIFVLIMTAILYYMHTKFIDATEEWSIRFFDLYQRQEETAYGYYISKINPNYLKILGEELGHEPTTEELNAQYTQYVRRWLNIQSIDKGASVNLYDENFENGTMSFDKPYLSLQLHLYDNSESPNAPVRSNIFYSFQNEEVIEKMNEIRNISNLNLVLIHLDGYYVKGTEFIPKNLYFGTPVANIGFYPDIDALFADGENYDDIEYGQVDRVIHIDTGCGSKEEMESQGYRYVEANLRGYWGSALSELTPIYPLSSEQDNSQKLALDSFDHDELKNTTQTTEHSSISYDHNITTWGFDNISYANIVRPDPALTSKRLNLVYRYEINFWDEICWDYGFQDETIPILGWTRTNKNFFITGCLISGLMWIIITAILSTLAYQKKKNTYDMNIYQRDLTNIMAHDLKSPLTVIRGSAENLQDNGSNEYAETIINEADYMSTLISRILSLSKLESNQEKMKSEAVNFKDIINDIIEKYSDETDRRNIHISVKESDNILTVKGDSFWISEALSNLIDNAIKYSPDSSEINIELREKQISIRNKMSDPDINEKELEKLKKSFMRGDNSRSGQSGNGLGLTIAENILTRNHLSLNLKKDGDDFIASII